MKLTIERVVIILLGIGLLISIGTCKYGKDRLRTQHDSEIISLKAQYADSIKNKEGEIVAIQEAFKVSTEKSLKDYTDTIFNLKKKQERQIKDVVSYYKATTVTGIHNVMIPYKDTTGFKKFSDSVTKACADVIKYYNANAVKVPMDISDSTKDYILKGSIDLKGLKINSLELIDDEHVRVVVLKGGFLKKDQQGKRHLFTKRSLQVQVLHSNQLIKVKNISSITYVAPKKHQLLWKTIILGAGIYLGSKL